VEGGAKEEPVTVDFQAVAGYVPDVVKALLCADGGGGGGGGAAWLEELGRERPRD
jgi:hypothetical protein